MASDFLLLQQQTNVYRVVAKFFPGLPKTLTTCVFKIGLIKVLPYRVRRMKYAWISTFRIFPGFGVSIHSDCFGAFNT